MRLRELRSCQSIGKTSGFDLSDLSVTLIITRRQPPWRKTKTHATGRVHDDVSQATDAEIVTERIAL